MRNTRAIKKLADEAINYKGDIDQKIADFVLKKLTKKELKLFLRTLKKRSMEKTVIVKYDGPLSSEIKKSIESSFKDKRIIYDKNENLGGGIEVIDNDMVVNYTIAGLINNKLQQI